MTREDIMALKKALLDLRFLQAAAVVALGSSETKQSTAYMANLTRLDKVLDQELLS